MQTLLQLREEINQIDSDIIEKLVTRKKLSKDIGEIKLQHGMDIIDPLREKELYAAYEKLSLQYGLEPAFVKALFTLIIGYCRGVQK